MPASSSRTPVSASPRATASVWSAATAPARRPSRRSSPARACPPRHRHPLRRGRLPPAGPAHRRSGRARPRPRPAARGLDVLIRKMRENEQRIATGKGSTRDKAMKQYERQETEFLTKGGYAAEAEAATIAAALNLPDRVLGQPCTRSPAVSAAVSSWPASSSPTRTRCYSTSRPTTSTPTRSSGCATTSSPTAAASSSSRTTSTWSTRSSTRCSTWTRTVPRSTSTT